MWLAGPRVSGYDGNGSGVSLQWCWHAACFQRCPSRCHMSDKNKLNRTDLYTHVYSSGSMYSCCSWSAAKRRRLRVRGCLQLTWLGELVRTFSSEPGTRGPGHHDAMTEAPGRKNDCHFSSVPGARGRAAKIGEVCQDSRKNHTRKKTFPYSDVFPWLAHFRRSRPSQTSCTCWPCSLPTRLRSRGWSQC